jgi:hypothetical protein
LVKDKQIILGISLGQEIENLKASNPVSFISFTSSYNKCKEMMNNCHLLTLSFPPEKEQSLAIYPDLLFSCLIELVSVLVTT